MKALSTLLSASMKRIIVRPHWLPTLMHDEENPVVRYEAGEDLESL
jgi:hypothetical protein